MRTTRDLAARRRPVLVGWVVGWLLGLVWVVDAPPARAEPVGWVAGSVRAQG